MLLIAFSALILFALGLVAVAKVAQRAMRRLGLELATVLLFFGLAEAPVDELARRRTAPARRAQPSLP